MLVDDASLASFYGWKLYYEFGDNDKSFFRHLDKVTKKVHKLYKHAEIKLPLPEVSWLIFCCAKLKEELYKEINYKMLSFMIDEQTNTVRVAFEKHQD